MGFTPLMASAYSPRAGTAMRKKNTPNRMAASLSLSPKLTRRLITPTINFLRFKGVPDQIPSHRYPNNRCFENITPARLSFAVFLEKRCEPNF